MYVVTVIKGKLYLIGRLEVGQIVDQAEAARILPYELYQADDHLIARPGTATSHDFDCQVSDEITASLHFFSGPKKLPAPLKFVIPGRLDQQTLRGVRQLTPDSAAEFEKILNAPVTV